MIANNKSYFHTAAMYASNLKGEEMPLCEVVNFRFHEAYAKDWQYSEPNERPTDLSQLSNVAFHSRKRERDREREIERERERERDREREREKERERERERGNNNLTKKNQRYPDDVDCLNETSRSSSISILVTGSVAGLTAAPAYTFTKHIFN